MFCVGIVALCWYDAGIIVNSVVIVRNTFYFECSRFTCNFVRWVLVLILLWCVVFGVGWVGFVLALFCSGLFCLL